VGYFDWHDQPGYFRDVTRHFAPDMALLDVGAGIGWLGDHFPHYTGIDGSPDAVAAAAERGRNVILADIREPLAFADASFDAIVLKDVLEHIQEPAALLAEVRRVLRPGGSVFASSPDAQRWVWDDYTHVRPFSRRGLRRLFEDQGFTVQRSGFESVLPGVGVLSGLTRRKRRPRAFVLVARVRWLRRNVWLVARH
jgi:SAM-dependent methyltransferase